MTHVHLELITKPVISKQFLEFQGRSMECLWAWIILMLLTCVKPDFEYVCVGSVSEITAYSAELATQGQRKCLYCQI